MKNPDFKLKTIRDAEKLFEAQVVKSQLRHLDCWSQDLHKLIGELEQRIRWEVVMDSMAYFNEHGHYGPWACHACGGDDGHGRCEHCHNDRIMTVDDVVEAVYRKGGSNGC